MTSEAFSLRDREAEEEDAELITFQTRGSRAPTPQSHSNYWLGNL